MFRFSMYCVSVRVEGSCSYSSLFTCPLISSISMSENQPFLSIILAWSVSHGVVVINLAEFAKFQTLFFCTLFVLDCS